VTSSQDRTAGQDKNPTRAVALAYQIKLRYALQCENGRANQPLIASRKALDDQQNTSKDPGAKV
jgi:hypothetical protein